MKLNEVKGFWLFIIFCLGCCLSTFTSAATVDTQVSRNKVSIGETVTVRFNLHDSTASHSPDFSPLQKDFQILGTNYGTAINVSNGVIQNQTIWEVTLAPKTTGELLIPEINFGTVKSAARKLLVDEAASVIQNDQVETASFVQAKLDTTSPYVQGQILYTFKLFYRTQFDSPRLEPPPITEGMLVQVGDDKSYQTTIKGEQFFVFEKNFAIFPQKPGKFIIPPSRFRALTPDSNSNFLTDPFSITADKPVNLATQRFVLDVRNIPTHFQGKIWLPAKNISLTEQWSVAPKQWEIGNPVTRTITIEALGLRADQIPDLAIDTSLPGLNIYPDRPQRNNRLQGNGVLGVWQQKITYIPNLQQSFTIPAVQLPWWNTQKDSNALAQLKPIAVQVQASIKNPGSSLTNTPLAKTITPPNHIASVSSQAPKAIDQGSVTTKATLPFYFTIWFWVALFFLVIWIMTLGWIWKHKNATKTHAESNVIAEADANPEQWHEKTFAQACKLGEPMIAQKYLLLWAKTQWENPPHSLGKLHDLLADENFKTAIENLEQTLYADQMRKWDGSALFAAFQAVKKNKRRILKGKSKLLAKKRPDPLPPLYL